MNIIDCMFLATVALTGCTSAPWQSQTYSDHQAVGRVLFDEIAKLEAGTLKPSDLVPALQDKRALFVDDDGFRITVRDLAFGILDEAGIEDLPAGTAPVFICGCKVNGQWYRFHVSHLTDQGFEQAIMTIQQTPAGAVLKAAPEE